MEPMAVAVDLVIIAILFVIAVLLTCDRPRAWLLTQGSELAGRYGRPEHTPEWELEHAELWLMARRKQLTEDLRRVEQLLLHDASMSATRQLGNRLAREQLLARSRGSRTCCRAATATPRTSRSRTSGRSLARHRAPRQQCRGAGRQRLALTGRSGPVTNPHVRPTASTRCCESRPWSENAHAQSLWRRGPPPTRPSGDIGVPAQCAGGHLRGDRRRAARTGRSAVGPDRRTARGAEPVHPVERAGRGRAPGGAAAGEHAEVRAHHAGVWGELRPREHPARAPAGAAAVRRSHRHPPATRRLAVHPTRCGSGGSLDRSARARPGHLLAPRAHPPGARRALADVADLPDHLVRPGTGGAGSGGRAEPARGERRLVVRLRPERER